ncbi:hypothetical protein BH11MYX3_BH11MYX3_33850 [soil metagenome]
MLIRHTLLALALAACTRDSRSAGAPAPAPGELTALQAPPPGSAPPMRTATPSAPAPMDPGPAAAPEGEGVSGTVVETMDSGGYTYAKLDHGGTIVWVAGPETKLAVGTRIGSVTGSLMTGFQSTTLKRTFDEIYFIPAFAIDGAVAPAAPHPSVLAMAQKVETIAPPAGGQTIASLAGDKGSAAGTAVLVRGKVVKVNNGILGHNWVHLQDGSGDLTLTTDATLTLGQVVAMRGTVARNKDFGAGYTYAVLLENATVEAH